MLRLLLTTLALLALLLPATAQAPPGGWPAPGDGFDWQTVGDRPVSALSLAFDDLGRLWGGGDCRRLDDPDDPDGVWIEFDYPWCYAVFILPLGRGDTVLTGGAGMRRTLDGGVTWHRLSDTGASGDERLAELPPGAAPGPAGLGPGDLFSADGDGLWRSTDRSDTWTLAPFLGPDPFPFSTVYDVLALPAGHPRAGHLVVATVAGGYVSDTTDAGALAIRRGTGHENQTVFEHLALLPSGRVLATGYRVGSGANSAFYSDDGGESWTEAAQLPEPSDGIPGDAWLAVLGPETAVAVGGRGVVYRTDDAGATWAVAGRVPITENSLTSRDLLVDAEGRLLVAVARSGPYTTGAWVYRTAESVLVAEVGAPPARAPLALSVAPNPAAESASVRFTLAAAGPVRLAVYDALGRRVATLHDGTLGEGPHTFSLGADLAPGVYVVHARTMGADGAADMQVVRWTRSR